MPKPHLRSVFKGTFDKSAQPTIPDISFGEISFAENPSFTCWLINQYSKTQPGIPTFEQFLELRKLREPSFSAPRENDPRFEPTPEQLARFKGAEWKGKSKKITTVIKAKNFLDAQKVYDQRHQEHVKMAERSRHIAQAYNGDFEGYRLFLCDPVHEDDCLAFPSSLPDFDRNFFISEPGYSLKEADRQRHTYITAESGHGKSVTIERLIFHYANNDYSRSPTNQPCVVLLDPHGDLAESVARFKGIEERLVYIKPALSKSQTPTINPFELQSKNWGDIALATDAFIEVFREVMKGDKDGTQFTPQMVTILKPCIATLLHMDNTSVADLIPFLSEEKAECQTYLNHALQHLSNPAQIEFLKRDFFKTSYNPSKLSIKTKLRNLLADDYFYNFLCGKTTIDLDKAIRSREIILFDLSDQTEAAGSAIGRFAMATITKFAFTQGNLPYEKRVPIHLFVDECQDYISDSMKQIVTKTRKFKLYGTFAQQFCGQGMDTELKRAIIGNSRIKITGGNELSSLKTIAAETGAPVEELQNLQIGRFHIKAGKSPSVVVKIPMVAKKQKLNREEWEMRKQSQLNRYYREIDYLRNRSTGDPSAVPIENIDHDENRQTNLTASTKPRRKPAYSLKS